MNIKFDHSRIVLGAFIALLGSLGPLPAEVPPTLDSVVQVQVYADDSYPPYSYLEGNTVKGIYTDVLRIAFARMKGFSVSIVANPWKRILIKVEAGDYFAFYPPYYLPKERPYVEPYSVPILEEVVCPVCRREVMTQEERTRWPEDFYGLIFANNYGFQIGGPAFLAAIQEGKIKIEEAHTTEQNLQKLAAGRVDCYINDRIAILQTLRALRKRRMIGPLDDFVLGPIAKREFGYVGYAKDATKFPYKDAFVKELDAILTKMKESGEIARIVKSYTD